MPVNNSTRVTRYQRLAIATILLLALLLPLGTYIFWILGGAATYFIFLVYYYSPTEKASQTKNFTQQKEDRANQREKVARLKFMGIVGIIGLLALFTSLLWPSHNELPVAEDLEDRKTLLRDADNLDALTKMGNRFYADQQYDSALFYYNWVLEVDPRNSSGLYNKGLALYQKQEYDQSVALLKECVNLYPDYGEAYALLGDNFYLQEGNTEALNWYRKAYDKGINTTEVLNLLGYLYDKQRNTTESVRFYKEALQQDSSLVDIYDRLVFLESGQAQKYQQLAEKWRK